MGDVRCFLSFVFYGMNKQNSLFNRRRYLFRVIQGLELDHLSLPLLFSSNLEVLAPLDGQLLPGLAFTALHPKDDLLGSLGLLPEDRFGLTSVTTLFSIVPSSSLSNAGFLSLLVLGYLVGRVFLTLALTVGFPDFWNVNHDDSFRIGLVVKSERSQKRTRRETTTDDEASNSADPENRQGKGTSSAIPLPAVLFSIKSLLLPFTATHPSFLIQHSFSLLYLSKMSLRGHGAVTVTITVVDRTKKVTTEVI